MTEFPVLHNAPITEAILEIKVKLPEKVTLETLEGFQDTIKVRFKERKTRHVFQARFQFSGREGASIHTSPEDKPDGYLFHAPEEKKTVQARLDGFAFNKLRPYENWAKFYKEARELWELYARIANPTQTEKITLRYINRFEIPLPFADFNEYILTNPQIAPGLPQSLSHFFMRLQIPNEDIGAIAIIIQNMEEPSDSQRLPLVLDIDVQKMGNYIGEEAKMWEDFNKLRDFKNNIFFKSITEKTKELFK